MDNTKNIGLDQNLLMHPDSLEVKLDIENAELLPEPLPIKKYAKFHKDSLIQIETRTATELPTDNTEDGSVWHEVDDHFIDGKHHIIDPETNLPRTMTDFEHSQWQEDMIQSGALLYVRNHRKILLSETDWIETANLDSDKKKAWQDYRQALRDLPEITKDHDVIWPTPPEPLPAHPIQQGGTNS
jgi:hypothetical protein